MKDMLIDFMGTYEEYKDALKEGRDENGADFSIKFEIYTACDELFFAGDYNDVTRLDNAILTSRVMSWDGVTVCDADGGHACDIISIMIDFAGGYYVARFWDSNDGMTWDGKKQGKRDALKRLLFFDYIPDAEDIEKACYKLITRAGWCDGFMFCDYKRASTSQAKLYTQTKAIIDGTKADFCADCVADFVANVGANPTRWTKEEIKNDISTYIL